jgi:8-oxo-dGTP pyrophosphatase MutT (NUDIX family)
VYTQSAKRELEEELGIADADMFHMFDFLYEDDTTKVETLVPMNALAMALFILEIRSKTKQLHC